MREVLVEEVAVLVLFHRCVEEGGPELKAEATDVQLDEVPVLFLVVPGEKKR